MFYFWEDALNIKMPKVKTLVFQHLPCWIIICKCLFGNFDIRRYYWMICLYMVGFLIMSKSLCWKHFIKSVRIQSYSAPHFYHIFLHSDWIRREIKYISLFSRHAGKSGKDVDQNNSEYGHLLRSAINALHLLRSHFDFFMYFHIAFNTSKTSFVYSFTTPLPSHKFELGHGLTWMSPDSNMTNFIKVLKFIVFSFENK